MKKYTGSREHLKKYSYSVDSEQVKNFVKKNRCVENYLKSYEKKSYYRSWAGSIVRFFNWLKIVKGIDVSPEEFLNQHLKHRGSENVVDRSWALNLVLGYGRDNPDLVGKNTFYICQWWFLPVKLFFDHHELPLTSKKGFFEKFQNRYEDVPFTVETTKKILASLNQRERAVCMIMLQSGQSIRQVLVDISSRADYIFSEIDSGKKRIRFDFRGRKGNAFRYFSFISVDAIQEINKYRPIRQAILDKLNIGHSPYLFITTDRGTPYQIEAFLKVWKHQLRRKNMSSTAWDVRSHGFRKFFEQESSPPERGVDKGYVAFMMGHSRGPPVKFDSPMRRGVLDVVGGVYDKTPLTYPEVVENEYVKLEPYLNIFTGGYKQKISELEKANKVNADLVAKNEGLSLTISEMKRRYDEIGRKNERRYKEIESQLVFMRNYVLEVGAKVDSKDVEIFKKLTERKNI